MKFHVCFFGQISTFWHSFFPHLIVETHKFVHFINIPALFCVISIVSLLLLRNSEIDILLFHGLPIGRFHPWRYSHMANSVFILYSTWCYFNDLGDGSIDWSSQLCNNFMKKLFLELSARRLNHPVATLRGFLKVNMTLKTTVHLNLIKLSLLANNRKLRRVFLKWP